MRPGWTPTACTRQFRAFTLRGYEAALPYLAAAKLRPRLRDIWGNLTQVAATPRKLVLLAGGSFGSELLMAMALSVSLRAFGDHLRLPVLIVVITVTRILGGIAPSGGMGVVEASMILGLTAAGVSEGAAAIVDPAAVAAGEVDIYAWSNFLEEMANEFGEILQRQSMGAGYFSGSFLGPEEMHHHGIGLIRPGAPAYIPPTKFFSEDTTLTVAGLELTAFYTGGEAISEFGLHIPEFDLIAIADEFFTGIPNLHSIRGFQAAHSGQLHRRAEQGPEREA